jgi:hypothetical protein
MRNRFSFVICVERSNILGLESTKYTERYGIERVQEIFFSFFSTPERRRERSKKKARRNCQTMKNPESYKISRFYKYPTIITFFPPLFGPHIIHRG